MSATAVSPMRCVAATAEIAERMSPAHGTNTSPSPSPSTIPLEVPAPTRGAVLKPRERPLQAASPIGSTTSATAKSSSIA